VICVECKPDAILVETLGFKEPIHMKGNAKVTKYVCDNDGVTGFQDEEPFTHPPRLLGKFKETSRKHAMVLMEWKERRIVILQPRLEEWILKTAELERVDPEEMRFNLYRDPARLKDVINLRPANFRRLTDALSGSQRMRALQTWLSGKD
jgi:hypothetical protein